jgi:hypothetical protein
MAVTLAEPVSGTERETGMDGVLLADCANCPDEIWSSEGFWPWEHFDTDVAECKEEG